MALAEWEKCSVPNCDQERALTWNGPHWQLDRKCQQHRREEEVIRALERHLAAQSREGCSCSGC